MKFKRDRATNRRIRYASGRLFRHNREIAGIEKSTKIENSPVLRTDQTQSTVNDRPQSRRIGTRLLVENLFPDGNTNRT